MSEPSKAKRQAAIESEVGYALGRGEFPQEQLDEATFLHAATPDQEHDGHSINQRDIEPWYRRQKLERGKGLHYQQLTISAPQAVDNV